MDLPFHYTIHVQPCRVYVLISSFRVRPVFRLSGRSGRWVHLLYYYTDPTGSHTILDFIELRLGGWGGSLSGEKFKVKSAFEYSVLVA